jgi:hypothetical protein
MVLNDARRIAIANVCIFLVILGFALHILTMDREIKGVPDLSPFEDATTLASTPVVTNTTSRETYPDFGNARIFDTLVPRPTPSPTPPPTPQPDPDLAEALNEYRIEGLLPKLGVFHHVREPDKQIQIRLGETYTIRYRGQEMVVRLESIDMRKFSATFSFTGRRGKQTHTISVMDGQGR